MFVDSDLMNVWNILEIKSNSNKGYEYTGKDIRYMIGTTSWIFLRQEGKKLFNKHMKYNLFYSKAIGAVIYVPAFMCRDFSKCYGVQLVKHVPNYNHSNTEQRILNEKAFDYQYQEKIQIILDRETESLLNCGERKQLEIHQHEKQAEIDRKLQMTESEIRVTEALEKFETIAEEFSTELSLLLKKYNIELYYNTCDENTNIKFNGEELGISITELIRD